MLNLSKYQQIFLKVFTALLHKYLQEISSRTDTFQSRNNIDVRGYWEQQPCEYSLGITQNHPSPCRACVEEVPFRDVIDCPFSLVPHARSYPVAALPIYRLP